MIPPNKNKRQFGLRPTPPDERDFPLGQIITLPDLSDLPKEFILPTLDVYDQKDSDFCTAFMSCLMSEKQEGITLEPSWSFAKSKEISGDVSSWGQDIRTALKTHVKSGGLPASLSPYSLETDAPSFLRDIKNWPKLEDKAYPHRKKSFFKVTGPYDHFDNARASIWKFKDIVGTGVNWGWKANEFYLNYIPTGGYGHAVPFIGFTTMDDGQEVLVLQNSYSERKGIKGLYYVTREVYNHFANMYGAYLFVDISPEEAKKCLDYGIKLEDSWLVKLLKRLLAYV